MFSPSDDIALSNTVLGIEQDYMPSVPSTGDDQISSVTGSPRNQTQVVQGAFPRPLLYVPAYLELGLPIHCLFWYRYREGWARFSSDIFTFFNDWRGQCRQLDVLRPWLGYFIG